METFRDWLAGLTVAELDFLLLLLFGFLVWDKAKDEFRIVRISDRLTAATERTPLGWAYRNKTLTLGWMMVALGGVSVLRGIPFWDEPRWLVLAIRTSLIVALLWNKLWRRRAVRALEERLAAALDGTPESDRPP